MIFSRNLLVLVTKQGIDRLKTCKIHNYSLPTNQPGLFWETSCFTLANSAWPSLRRLVQSVPLMVQCCHCLVTEADKRVVCWLKPMPVSRQSVCRQPCHKSSGRLPVLNTRLVVTCPVTEHHHKLQCWMTEAQCVTVDNLSVTTHATLYSLFMLVQLASTITSPQHPTHE